jgi:hypothetical protein
MLCPTAGEVSGYRIQRINDNKRARKEEYINGLEMTDSRRWKAGSRMVDVTK